MNNQRWSKFIEGRKVHEPGAAMHDYVIGVVQGEGIGPELVKAALEVLAALESAGLWKFQVQVYESGEIDSRFCFKTEPGDEFVKFCRNVFSMGGTVLTGPVGGRFVYDLRKCFDLFCKIYFELYKFVKSINI
ncbi:MAG TPA: hypothetical protein VJL89_02030 [Thermodesulfovibrionia bacterium]|nr:hypothetical protein [Thermodesulfovibrionia bacterium]